MTGGCRKPEGEDEKEVNGEGRRKIKTDFPNPVLQMGISG